MYGFHGVVGARFPLPCMLGMHIKAFGLHHEVPCRRVLETARAISSRDARLGVDTGDPVVKRLAKAKPTHAASCQSFIHQDCLFNTGSVHHNTLKCIVSLGEGDLCHASQTPSVIACANYKKSCWRC